MVDYSLAFAKPFSNLRKLVVNCLIFLGFAIAIVAVMILFSIVGAIFSNTIINYIPSIIGIILFAIPSLYFLLVAKQPKKDLPTWSNFRKIFEMGLKYGVILAVFSLIFILIANILTPFVFGEQLMRKYNELSQIDFVDSGSPSSSNLGQQVGQIVLDRLVIILPVFLLVALLNSLITSIAGLNLIHTERFGAGLDLGKIFRIAADPRYLLPFLIASLIAGLYFAIFLIISVVLIFTIVGIILLPFIAIIFWYILGVTQYTILGQAFLEVK